MKWLTNYRLIKIGQYLIYTAIIIAIVITVGCLLYDINKEDLYSMLNVPKLFLNMGLMFYIFAAVNHVFDQIIDQHEKEKQQKVE